ncbi:M4 family metallopeptidase [Phycicoccus sonneratiae]|uniref:Neutral metalloproteinase n=1 Tax=Phycicoccus sonneratiae TaxID=2807628 RepID=A0ABS2CQC6_9MICO|nr:M4 family metallopeptidase [Phycicoccus sonneraticus]MBM6402023.1 M4 family metallopeptidase [Phycicoccus sonneraticus]
MPRRLLAGSALVATMTAGVVAAAPATAVPTPTPAAGQYREATARVAAARADEGRRTTPTARALGLPAGEALTVRSVVLDPDGTRHVRYDRTSGGLRVVGGDLVVTKAADGRVRDKHLATTRPLAVASRTPKVTAAAARATAGRSAGYRPTSSAAALVVYAAGSSNRLAWEVTTEGVRSTGTPSRLRTYVDARTGAVLDRAEAIHEGTGNTQYSGVVTLNTVTGGAGFRLRDSVGNYTTDMFGLTSGTGTEFTGADDIWGTGSVSARDTAAADAQWGAQQTYAYYQSVHNRAGIWNTGVGARSRVHFASGYVNAFWDGTQMTYGDGRGNTHPLTSIDVAGHEMSHGVTENTAGLSYRGESGGLNEATSDIFGAAVEFYASNPSDPGDYLIGEKIDINGNGTPLRYMDDPSRDGQSPGCWSRSIGRMDVHYSSGPLNHWYYLVSEGSGTKTVGGVTYTSPTCDGSSMTGVGHLVAERVWYRTLTTKLTSSSNYGAARNGAIASAKELYGKNSAQCVAVEKAFNAIAAPKGNQTCAN